MVMMPDIQPMFTQGNVMTWVKEYLSYPPLEGKIDVQEEFLSNSL